MINIRVVTDASGNVEQETDYYPYGMPMATSTGAEVNRYKYSGKELETRNGLNFYDFEARLQFPTINFMNQTDVNAADYPWLNPYLYCAANPIANIDPTGKWSVKVSASEDRGSHPYATFAVFDSNDILVFSTVVKVRGSHRDRSKTNGDTPQGDSIIKGWEETAGNGRNTDAYGVNDLLALQYIGEEGKGRGGMHVHGGRPQKNDLMGTHGCIRMKDEDIKDFKEVMQNPDFVEESDKPTILTVTNDLIKPVEFADRNKYLIVGSIILPEVVVVYSPSTPPNPNYNKNNK